MAKVIPARRRGSFFGTRQLMGGLLTFAIAGALSNLLWGRVSERQGNRRLLLIAGALLALTPAAALLAPTLEGRLWPGAGGLTAAMGLVFLVSGIANDASNIAGMTYMLEIVPEAERPTTSGWRTPRWGW